MKHSVLAVSCGDAAMFLPSFVCGTCINSLKCSALEWNVSLCYKLSQPLMIRINKMLKLHPNVLYSCDISILDKIYSGGGRAYQHFHNTGLVGTPRFLENT